MDNFETLRLMTYTSARHHRYTPSVELMLNGESNEECCSARRRFTYGRLLQLNGPRQSADLGRWELEGDSNHAVRNYTEHYLSAQERCWKESIWFSRHLVRGDGRATSRKCACRKKYRDSLWGMG